MVMVTITPEEMRAKAEILLGRCLMKALDKSNESRALGIIRQAVEMLAEETMSPYEWGVIMTGATWETDTSYRTIDLLELHRLLQAWSDRP